MKARLLANGNVELILGPTHPDFDFFKSIADGFAVGRYVKLPAGVLDVFPAPDDEIGAELSDGHESYADLAGIVQEAEQEAEDMIEPYTAPAPRALQRYTYAAPANPGQRRKQLASAVAELLAEQDAAPPSVINVHVPPANIVVNVPQAPAPVVNVEGAQIEVNVPPLEAPIIENNVHVPPAPAREVKVAEKLPDGRTRITCERE